MADGRSLLSPPLQHRTPRELFRRTQKQARPARSQLSRLAPTTTLWHCCAALPATSFSLSLSLLLALARFPLVLFGTCAAALSPNVCRRRFRRYVRSEQNYCGWNLRNYCHSVHRNENKSWKLFLFTGTKFHIF